jgi:hypothetical protein
MPMGTPKGKLNMSINILSTPTGNLSKTIKTRHHTLNGKQNGKNMLMINCWQTNKSMNTLQHVLIGQTI